jgi:hypothetical protein
MTWDEDTDELVTEIGTYQVEWHACLGGYEAVLYNSDDEPEWVSEVIKSNPFTDDGTPFCDTKAVMKCREYAMDHYARRKP